MTEADLALGIDLGTTYVKVACNRAGRIDVIPSKTGQSQTPCAAWLNSQDAFIFGQEAMDALSIDPANGQTNFVRDLGTEVEYTFRRSSRRVKPEELTAEFLKSLRADAEQFVGREIRTAVIAVPPDADQARSQATNQAASLAGFGQCVLILDAIAAALAAGVVDNGVPRTVLVYDFGGRGFGASVLRICDGTVAVVGHAGDRALGGMSLDREVVERIFVPVLAASSGLDLSENDQRTYVTYLRLNSASETARLELNRAEKTFVFVSGLIGDRSGKSIDLRCEVTRGALEHLAQPLVDNTISICERLLTNSHIAPSEVNDVIPVGGMTLMPFVRQRIKDRFGEPMVTAGIDSATAVVRGAAIFASSHCLPNQTTTPAPCASQMACPSSPVLFQTVGIALHDNHVIRLFDKGTALPARHLMSLRTVVAFRCGQRGDAIKLQLVEGEGDFADINRELGTLIVPLENVSRDLPAGSEVEVSVEVDESRQFRVTAYIPVLDEEWTQQLNVRSLADLETHETSSADSELVRRLDEGIRWIEQALSERLMESLQRVQLTDWLSDARSAIENHNHESATVLLNRLHTLQLDCLMQDGGFWKQSLEQLKPLRGFITNQEAAATLFDEAHRSISHNDLSRLKDAVRGLFALLSKDGTWETSVGSSILGGGSRFVPKRAFSTVPTSRIDKVHFSVASPPLVQSGTRFIVDVWAHLERQRAEVERRVRQTCPQIDPAPVIRPKGPFKVERGTSLYVRLRFPALRVEPPEDVILWEGEIGNASFEVAIPSKTPEGVICGLASVHWDGGLQIARVPLQILIAARAAPSAGTTQPLHHIRKAFASYASSDRDEVLGRVQGMQKIAPDLDVFLDVLKLRSGEDWEKRLWQVIPESDVFYLFWSAAAKASPWVEKEWRCALGRRGEDFIDPVPLVSPEEVRPPEELSKKHFNDWILAFRRGKPSATA